MQIGLILAHRYPNEPEPPLNYEVRTDAEGNQWISFWNESVFGTQPTNDQLRSWWLDAEKWNKRRLLAHVADREYDRMLFPDSVASRVERDETLEKKAANRAGANISLIGQEPTLSKNIDNLRSKYTTKKQDVNNVTQQAGETLEQTVERVRAVQW